MDNIDKTLILSYPRTGSTALVDVYRLYLENAYPNDYYNIPSEPLEEDQFFNFKNYLGERYPYHHFCDKHNFPKIDINNLLIRRNSTNMNSLGDSIFKAVLSEPFFAVKIFPKHIDLYYDYMKQVLLNHVNQGNNLICLYRKNFLDTISSIITCTATRLWVSTAPRTSRSIANPGIINVEEDFLKDDLRPLRETVNGLKTWHKFYNDLSKEYKDIKIIAYEDIKSFDSNLLSSLHNVNIDNFFESRVKKQHYKQYQDLILEKHKHLVYQVLTKSAMKELPLDSKYRVVL